MIYNTCSYTVIGTGRIECSTQQEYDDGKAALLADTAKFTITV